MTQAWARDLSQKPPRCLVFILPTGILTPLHSPEDKDMVSLEAVVETGKTKEKMSTNSHLGCKHHRKMKSCYLLYTVIHLASQ